MNLVCDSVKRQGIPLLFTTPTGLLAVELDNPLPMNDSTVLDIFYHRESTAAERGYFFARPPTVTHTYCMTCTAPEDARYWMPCYDEPSDKAERGVELMLRRDDRRADGRRLGGQLDHGRARVVARGLDTQQKAQAESPSHSFHMMSASSRLSE